MRKFLYTLLATMALPAAASAQQQIIQYFQIQSGTGFFVNNEYVITNAHVVKGCDNVALKGAVQDGKASVRFLDEDNDLALIETSHQPQQFAPLRFNIDDLKGGDKVLLLGYPGEAGLRGEITTATAQVINVPEMQFMQDKEKVKGKFFITDVVNHGNSGGPVFDTSGNVIGVVVAKSQFYVVNPITQEKVSGQHVGMVIDLNTLKQFLFDHGVYTEWMGSNLLYTDSYIEDNAKNYIVNVQCQKATDHPPGVVDMNAQPVAGDTNGQ